MKLYIKILLGVVLFIAIAGIGTAIYEFVKPHKDLNKAKPDYVISAVDLQKAFEDNETLATAKFVKKVIEVSGVVESLKTGEGNTLNVTVKTGSDLSSVICTFSAVTYQSKFTPGSQVTIRGECSGFLMDVLMNNCALINK